MPRKGILVRDVTDDECPWLYKNHKKGEVVYEHDGKAISEVIGETTGFVGTETEIAVTDSPNGFPPFEIPRDSVQWDAE